MALVGANVPLGKILLADFGPLALSTIRCALAAALLWPLALWAGEWRVTAPRSAWRIVLVQALLGIVAFNVLILWGLQRTTGVEAGLVTSTLPAVTAICAVVALAERPGRRVLAGIALAVAGLAIVTLGGARDPSAVAGGSLGGNLLVLGAVVAEANFIVAARHAVSRMPPIRMAAAINAVAVPMFLPFALGELGAVDWAAVAPATWALMLAYSLGASVIAFFCWFWGLRFVPAAEAGVFTVFLPVTAVAASVAALGEELRLVHAVGFVVLIGSLLITTWPSRAR